MVKLKNGQELDGFLRYKGPISSQDPSVTFGVELVNHLGLGDSDGTHQGREFFHVGVNCAVFVSAHRVTALKHSSPLHLPQAMTPLILGERIVWMADSGPEYGTVRWIGVLDDVSDDWTVGVEFDNPVGTGTGKYKNEQLFRAKQNHASLIPIIGLMKEADFLGTHTSSSLSAKVAAIPDRRQTGP